MHRDDSVWFVRKIVFHHECQMNAHTHTHISLSLYIYMIHPNYESHTLFVARTRMDDIVFFSLWSASAKLLPKRKLVDGNV
jgi:hypothetical protein